MSDLYSKAKDFAIAAHGDQKYGKLPYWTHLEDVEGVLVRFGYDSPDYRAAAWLHDVLEDTPAKAPDLIHEGFPFEVVAMISAVTDEPGRNRKERKALTYPKIARLPAAIPLKVADRIANVEACLKSGDSKLIMYRKEHIEFYSWLSRDVDPRTAAMWEYLNRMMGLEEIPRA